MKCHGVNYTENKKVENKMIEVLFDPFSTLEMKKKELGSEAVIYLPLLFDIGTVYEDMSCKERTEFFLNLQSATEETEIVQEHIDTYQEDLRRLQTFIHEGKPIRAWISESSETQCGLCYLCNLVKDSESSISIVELQDGYARWQEVMPFHLLSYTEHEIQLGQTEVLEKANQWNAFVQDQKELRVYHDGIIESTEMDYYDSLMIGILLQGPVEIAGIWGMLQADNKHILDLSFVNQRIDTLIQQRRVRVYDEGGRREMRTVGLIAKEGMF